MWPANLRAWSVSPSTFVVKSRRLPLVMWSPSPGSTTRERAIRRLRHESDLALDGWRPRDVRSSSSKKRTARSPPEIGMRGGRAPAAR
jgi:hypothetical protein